MATREEMIEKLSAMKGIYADYLSTCIAGFDLEVASIHVAGTACCRTPSWDGSAPGFAHNADRTHIGVGKDSPSGRPVEQASRRDVQRREPPTGPRPASPLHLAPGSVSRFGPEVHQGHAAGGPPATSILASWSTTEASFPAPGGLLHPASRAALFTDRVLATHGTGGNQTLPGARHGVRATRHKRELRPAPLGQRPAIRPVGAIRRP